MARPARAGGPFGAFGVAEHSYCLHTLVRQSGVVTFFFVPVGIAYLGGALVAPPSPTTTNGAQLAGCAS
jgi:hypothetical protein